MLNSVVPTYVVCVCVCGCIGVCVYVGVCVFIRTYARAYERIHVFVWMFIHSHYTYACTLTRACVRTRSVNNARCIVKDVRQCACVRAPVYAYARLRRPTQTRERV